MAGFLKPETADEKFERIMRELENHSDRDHVLSTCTEELETMTAEQQHTILTHLLDEVNFLYAVLTRKKHRAFHQMMKDKGVPSEEMEI